MNDAWRARFEKRIHPSGECLLFVGATRAGYGVFKIDKKVVSAHRVSYELAKGEIAEGLVVMHSCDNRLCVNPEHLSLGTLGANARDCWSKGRSHFQNADRVRGEDHGIAKLTTEEAQAIFDADDPNISMLALKYGVSRTTVRNVRKGATWSHLTRPQQV